MKSLYTSTLSNIKLFGGQSNSFSFLVLLFLSLVMGMALNYTMFLCTIVNSALTTTIVGVLKGVGSTVRECFEEMPLVKILFNILRCQ